MKSIEKEISRLKKLQDAIPRLPHPDDIKKSL
jgi:hypothetical protein